MLVEVANAGRLKNIPALLRAFRKVRRTVPVAELRLIGPGLERDAPLATWARNRRLAAGVRFVGSVSRAEVSTHLSEAWVHVHASLEESFGMSILEALALGTPVVAGRSAGAVPWVLADGVAGVLVDVRDPEALAKSVLALLMDEERRAQLA
ncbi:glycosyltransferase, partial [Georgenia sp. 10Sc9-8]|nr:glycosyltransferase [Georgenia halotolerans]